MRAKAVEEGSRTAQDIVSEDLEALGRQEGDDEPLRVEPYVLTVRRQFKGGGDLVTDPDEVTEGIAVRGFHVEPARVAIRVNHTNNMGSFWSMSVQVGLEVPCYREEYEEAMEFASKVVSDRLAKEIEKGADRVAEYRRQRSPSNLF